LSIGSGISLDNEMIALWDLGNVVVQWNPDEILRMLSLPPDKSSVVKELLCGGSRWLDLDRGVTTEAEVAKLIASESSLDVDEMLHCFDIVRDSLVDFPKSIELIGEMKAAGIPQYVLSNMSTVNADYLRSRPYFDLFDGIVFSAAEKLIKPDTALFELVLDRYQLQAHQIVFIDDSLPNIEAAVSLGMNGVHFKASDNCYARVRKFFPKLCQ